MRLHRPKNQSLSLGQERSFRQHHHLSQKRQEHLKRLLVNKVLRENPSLSRDPVLASQCESEINKAMSSHKPISASYLTNLGRRLNQSHQFDSKDQEQITNLKGVESNRTEVLQGPVKLPHITRNSTVDGRPIQHSVSPKKLAANNSFLAKQRLGHKMPKPTNPYSSQNFSKNKTPRRYRPSKNSMQLQKRDSKFNLSHRRTQAQNYDSNLLEPNTENDQWDEIVKFQANQEKEEEMKKRERENQQKEVIRKELEQQIQIQRKQKQEIKRQRLAEDEKILKLSKSDINSVQLEKFKKQKKLEQERELRNQELLRYQQ